MTPVETAPDVRVGQMRNLGLATLAFTCIEPYEAWLRQVSLASDPGWPAIGFPLGTLVGREIGLAGSIGTLALVLLMPRSVSVISVGVLTVLGSPSLHTYGLLFLLPAMLAVRLEIRLLVALLLATTPLGIWLGIVTLIATLLLRGRLPSLAAQPVQPVQPVGVAPTAA